MHNNLSTSRVMRVAGTRVLVVVAVLLFLVPTSVWVTERVGSMYQSSIEQAETDAAANQDQGQDQVPEGEKNDVDYILDLLSHMSFGQSVKSDDNGITQTVQVRKGVSFVENKAVRPIVTLAPYRTFQEVEQPESEFVFRVYDDRSISLTAADGGMWKLAARDAVMRYLETTLWDEIAAGKVKVTL